MASKTAMAFQMTCEKLARANAKLYLWTLTFREVPFFDWCAMDAWHQLHRKLEKLFPLMVGVRVSELHTTHGLHFHLIVNQRIDINVVLQVATPFGFGRIQVEEVRDKTATILYLSKYLSKAFKAENRMTKGARRWGTIGGFKATRCRDLVYENSFTKNKTLLYGDGVMEFRQSQHLMALSTAWGEWKNVPQPFKTEFLAKWKASQYKQTTNCPF